MWISTIQPFLAKKINSQCLSNFYVGMNTRIAPCVDPKLFHLIKKGINQCSSLTAHKLLRWQIQVGFDNWINNRKDPRLICTTGGYEGIARLIGCAGSHKAITEVKAILHAQAYAQFSFYDGSQGNMLVLREIEKHRNGQPSKINIILGELLLPNYAQLLPKGETRRLIPVPALLPMVGSNNTHAAQALLQLLTLEEFSNQSDRLFETGYVHLSREKWIELSAEAKLPKSMIERVISKWLEHGFLRKICTAKILDGFGLGDRYDQLAAFLHEQGKLRREGERAGERSAALKQKFRIKQYSSKKIPPSNSTTD